MEDSTPEIPSFDNEAMSMNIRLLQRMARRIRQNEGVGSKDDEVVLHRAVQDLDTLLEIIGITQVKYEKLEARYESLLPPEEK